MENIQTGPTPDMVDLYCNSCSVYGKSDKNIQEEIDCENCLKKGEPNLRTLRRYFEGFGTPERTVWSQVCDPRRTYLDYAKYARNRDKFHK